MPSPSQARILHASVNPLIGALFLFSIGLGATLIILHVAYNANPLADVFAATLY